MYNVANTEEVTTPLTPVTVTVAKLMSVLQTVLEYPEKTQIDSGRINMLLTERLFYS